MLMLKAVYESSGIAETAIWSVKDKKNAGRVICKNKIGKKIRKEGGENQMNE